MSKRRQSNEAGCGSCVASIILLPFTIIGWFLKGFLDFAAKAPAQHRRDNSKWLPSTRKRRY